jgi:hypothetical protein
MSMSFEAFSNLIDRIATLNDLDPSVAGRYAAAIGDTPELDEQGRAIVRDHDGTIVAVVVIKPPGRKQNRTRPDSP